MSIGQITREKKEEQKELDISDLNLTPLFDEVEQDGGLQKILPWVTIVLCAIILIVFLIKK